MLLKTSLMFTSILVLNGCLALTVVGGVVGSVDSFAKEMKINKLEKKIDALENKGTENGTKLDPTVGHGSQQDVQ